MTPQIQFPFSDTIGGTITSYDRLSDSFQIKTRLGGYQVYLKASTSAQMLRNLGEPYCDCTEQMREMIIPGRFLFVYCIFYPEKQHMSIEAQFLIFVDIKPGEFIFRKQD